jgi:hypothetical protein
LAQTGHTCAHCQRKPTHYSEGYDACAPHTKFCHQELSLIPMPLITNGVLDV